MIAYEELAAALERWRIRNGLPGTPPLFADGPRAAQPTWVKPREAPPEYASPASLAPSFAPPPAPAPTPPAPRTAPPIAPPPAAETIDEDVDVLDEDHLDNDGPDFAMNFNSPAAAPPARAPISAMSDDDAREASQIGGTDPGIVPPPDDEGADDVWPDAASFPTAEPRRSAATVVDDEDDGGGTLVNG